MGLFSRILRAGEGRKLRGLESLVGPIGALEPEMQRLDDAALKAKTAEFQSRHERGESLDELLIEAFAVVREASTRVLGQRHFDVQLMGGAALHYGWIAEMRTGEGKTLVSTLPLYLNGLANKGVHLITVNDYLAKFHAEWMGRLHNWLGLDVGLVIPDMGGPAEKRKAYAAHITYGTNNEFGFDYLRDNMSQSRDEMVQRGHAFAVIDEVDSILIDEARTPLIISGRVADAAKLYVQFSNMVRVLERDVHYEVDEEKRTVAILEEGIEAIENQLGVENLYEGFQVNLVHQLQVALKAKELYRRDRDYIVRDGEVLIVDEFTGRILPGRRWSEGLHQAVEAKERVVIKEENQTLATITLQNYFRMYDKLAGLTGTAVTEAGEFAHTYGLSVVTIPTNRPMIRADQEDLIYKTEDAKFNAVADDIEQRSKAGQPVLVGTVSVEKSEQLSKILGRRGVEHTVLNAKQHAREAMIVAQAGRLGAVTVATNMAGRGVDILLGGNPELLAEQELRARQLDPDAPEVAEERAALMEKLTAETKAEGEKVRELGGLYVLGTERHESRRIDNQLRGRSGRQGDPGESRFYLSLEDELMRLFATGALSWVMGRTFPDDEPIEAKMVSKAIERAQTTVEQRNAEIRKNVLKYDEVPNEQRKVIYSRRQQIIDGVDLRTDALDATEAQIRAMVTSYCEAEPQDWDLQGLLSEVAQLYPTEFTLEDINQSNSAKQLADSFVAEAVALYEQREHELGEPVVRDIERRVMLALIDQRWREHLYDMDYLHEGIHLRGIAQRDPLVEWQREGYEMFSNMMEAVQYDFVRTMFHLEVQVAEGQGPAIGTDMSEAWADGEDGATATNEGAAVAPSLVGSSSAPSASSASITNLTYSAPSEVVDSGASLRSAAAAGPIDEEGNLDSSPQPAAPEPMAPVVRSEWDKTPRNAPCPCGSGKKFKMCHGAK